MFSSSFAEGEHHRALVRWEYISIHPPRQNKKADVLDYLNHFCIASKTGRSCIVNTTRGIPIRPSGMNYIPCFQVDPPPPFVSCAGAICAAGTVIERKEKQC